MQGPERLVAGLAAPSGYPKTPACGLLEGSSTAHLAPDSVHPDSVQIVEQRSLDASRLKVAARGLCSAGELLGYDRVLVCSECSHGGIAQPQTGALEHRAADL